MLKARFWLALMAPFAFLIAGCPPADDDDSTGDDDDTVPVGVEDSNILDNSGSGVDDFYYESNIWVEFTDDPDAGSVTLTLTGPDGAVAGTTAMPKDDEATFDPGTNLAPNADYTLTVEWAPCDGCPIDIAFSTSDHGQGVTDEAGLVGNTYDIDLAGATFVEPPGVGSILASQIGDIRVLFTMTAASDFAGGTVDIVGAVGEEAGGNITVDPCTETLKLTETQPATWDSATGALAIGPADLSLSIQGITADIQQLLITGTVKPDGINMAGGVFAGTIDTRPLDGLLDDSGEEGAICDLVEETVGIPCDDCGGGEMFCLSLRAEDIIAELVPGLTIPARACEDILGDATCTDDWGTYDEDGDGTYELCPGF
jgi:hypothetical protein